MQRWQNIFRQPLPRRACAGLVLLAYLITSTGFAVPAAPRRGPGSPFPCQDHLCGCGSAEQCARSCCCYSPEQRRTWARAHGIAPARVVQEPEPSCCHGAEAACEHTAPTAPCHSEGDGGEGCCGSCTADGQAPRPETRWVPVLNTLKCRGLSTLWVSTGVVVPPAPVPTAGPEPAPTDWISPPDSDAPCRCFTPPDPPPRP